MTRYVGGWLSVIVCSVGVLAGCASTFSSVRQRQGGRWEYTGQEVMEEKGKPAPGLEETAVAPVVPPPSPLSPYGLVSLEVPRPKEEANRGAILLPPTIVKGAEPAAITQMGHPGTILASPGLVSQPPAMLPLPVRQEGIAPAAGKEETGRGSDSPLGFVPGTSSRESKRPSPLAQSLISPASPKEPLVDALQCVMNNQPHQALQYLQGYDPATQELLLRLLPYLDLIRRKGVQQLQSAEVAILHDQLQEMMHFLRPRTELVIDRACFCQSVKAFGVFQPLPEDHAYWSATAERPGELVQLYVELRNFCSEARESFHETCLSSSVEVRNAKGDKVWHHHFDDNKQPLRSRSRLNDYFNNYTFHVPQLPPGTYTLTIKVTDATQPDCQRQASKTLEFRVRSLPSRK